VVGELAPQGNIRLARTFITVAPSFVIVCRPFASTISRSPPYGPSVGLTVACTARHALMLDRICGLPCDVSVPSFRTMMVGACPPNDMVKAGIVESRFAGASGKEILTSICVAGVCVRVCACVRVWLVGSCPNSLPWPQKQKSGKLLCNGRWAWETEGPAGGRWWGARLTELTELTLLLDHGQLRIMGH
jgi:hypothetical protein